MIVGNFTNNYTLSSYNMQQKVGIMHSIRIKTSCPKFCFKKYFYDKYQRM